MGNGWKSEADNTESALIPDSAANMRAGSGKTGESTVAAKEKMRRFHNEENSGNL